MPITAIFHKYSFQGTSIPLNPSSDKTADGLLVGPSLYIETDDHSSSPSTDADSQGVFKDGARDEQSRHARFMSRCAS